MALDSTTKARKLRRRFSDNEGWLLRLVLTAAERAIPGPPIQVLTEGSWFSEALLYSAFLARRRCDSLAESLRRSTSNSHGGWASSFGRFHDLRHPHASHLLKAGVSDECCLVDAHCPPLPTARRSFTTLLSYVVPGMLFGTRETARNGRQPLGQTFTPIDDVAVLGLKQKHGSGTPSAIVIDSDAFQLANRTGKVADACRIDRAEDRLRRTVATCRRGA